MKTREFEDEAVVVKEGDMGDEFFIIQANPPPPCPPASPLVIPLGGGPQGRRRRLSEASYAQWRFGGAVCLNPSVRGELCAVAFWRCGLFESVCQRRVMCSAPCLSRPPPTTRLWPACTAST